MIYVDTSALVKLVLAEAESEGLRRWVGDEPAMVSSALLMVEARRGVLRREPVQVPRLDVLLGRIRMVDMSTVVVESASRLPDPLLRSLDAIHLATALLIRDDVEVLLTYDDRLAEAARSHGIEVAAPA